MIKPFFWAEFSDLAKKKFQNGLKNVFFFSSSNHHISTGFYFYFLFGHCAVFGGKRGYLFL
jgi:hypothetical protein